jgi:hypothetical protein
MYRSNVCQILFLCLGRGWNLRSCLILVLEHQLHAGASLCS